MFLFTVTEGRTLFVNKVFFIPMSTRGGRPPGGADSCTNPELLINSMLKLCALIGWFNRCQVCWQCFFPPKNKFIKTKNTQREVGGSGGAGRGGATVTCLIGLFHIRY